ncbi:MAG TPA: hypothetical protein VK714_02880 [Myxococcota bacterium]|nr:hypothetical protein [Myxococcota bacterium]
MAVPTPTPQQPQTGTDAQAADVRKPLLQQLRLDPNSVAGADPDAVRAWIEAHGALDHRELAERITTTSNELLRTAHTLAANGDTAGAEKLKATAGFYLASHTPSDADLADRFRKAIKVEKVYLGKDGKPLKLTRAQRAYIEGTVPTDYQYKPGKDYGPGTPPPLQIKPRIGPSGEVVRERYTRTDAD